MLRVSHVVPLLTTMMAAIVGLTSATMSAVTERAGSHYPPLELVVSAIQTVASTDFADHHEAFAAAHDWQRKRLLDDNIAAPYLACSEYGEGLNALEGLKRTFPTSEVYTITNTKEHGACFIVTAVPAEAEVLIEDPSASGFTSVGPFPSMLKLAPGLLDHAPRESMDESASSLRLTTTYGSRIKMPSMMGLSVRLSPGVMKAREPSVEGFLEEWRSGLREGSVNDLMATNFWSDPEMLQGVDGHLTRPRGALLAQEWTRAAELVNDMTKATGGSIGEACKWNITHVHPAEDDLLLLTDMKHLLPGDENSETRVACFMYFLSHLASKPEVFRVSPLSEARLYNDVVNAIVQSANIVDTPFFDAGLNGTGQVIQIIDSGLDETSCFFVDDDGQEIEHGSYYDGITTSSGVGIAQPSPPTSYTFDLSRRKIVQYIELFKIADPDADPIDGDGYYYYTELYGSGSGDGHHEDEEGGHGTGTAGVAAGATIADFVLPTCPSNTQPGCVGKCITTSQANVATGNNVLDIDTYCPSYSCDGNETWSPNCLDDDPTENLQNSAGVAPGAKLGIFDVSHGGALNPENPGNGLWEVSMNTGAKIHSNSWGFSEPLCQLTDYDTLYDKFVYENPEHLLIFSAGNQGGDKERSDGALCTVAGPCLGKNTLTVGATSTGPTRVPITGTDGRARYEELDEDPDGPVISYFGPPSVSTTGADIDTVAFFSSYGPTHDGRIKPEVVAPGDRVFTAASDGTDSYSCRLSAASGTSFAAPAVAGAAALVRQYFMESAFYVHDLEARGFCYDGTFFSCEPFSPSAATVKAVLINSANLMGGGTSPDGYRGFGRVHLEAGLPLEGLGNLVLYVVDSSTTSISSNETQTWTFGVDPTAGEDIRVTLSWIDPPSEPVASPFLLNDLDLEVTGPDGTQHYMWNEGPSAVDVNERVIIPATEVVSGTWTVEVSAGALTTTSQSYSLVITAAFGD